jgi:hypothetical protein
VSKDDPYVILRAAIRLTLEMRRKHGIYNLPGLRVALKEATAARRRQTLHERKLRGRISYDG